MELSYTQFSHLIRRFPDFELSYETISHNKVSNKYDICLAVPIGKKCYAWFTYDGNNNVCYLLDINRDKKISRAKKIPVMFDGDLSVGTVVYGTLWSEGRRPSTTNSEGSLATEGVWFDEGNRNFFIVEDILYFKGIPMKTEPFGSRLGFIQQLMNKTKQCFTTKDHMVLSPSTMWKVELNEKMWEFPTYIPGQVQNNIVYPVHHIQYRSSSDVMPYLNVNISKKIQAKPAIQQTTMSEAVMKLPRLDFSKPQYKQKTVFQVSADVQNDIYHLYAYGKNNQPVYYGIAYIPGYKSSVFMNSLFRNIRENINLDYIEESDDEENFEDMRDNKYVDLNKKVLMECAFHTKFKKWVPLRLVDTRSKVIHIFNLTVSSVDDRGRQSETYNGAHRPNSSTKLVVGQSHVVAQLLTTEGVPRQVSFGGINAQRPKTYSNEKYVHHRR